jgi:hypothetical protein
MIAIDNILVSDAVAKEQFVCDLSKCKGACCVDGDAGAPLENDELDKLNQVYEAVLPYLNEESKKELERQGRYVYDREYGWVTPTIGSKVCVYGLKDKDGKIKWKKPISCHLFPVIVKHSKRSADIYVNYEPREDSCRAACTFGKKLKVPVYEFLKEALTRKFGKKFYDALEATAQHLHSKK